MVGDAGSGVMPGPSLSCARAATVRLLAAWRTTCHGVRSLGGEALAADGADLFAGMLGRGLLSQPHCARPARRRAHPIFEPRPEAKFHRNFASAPLARPSLPEPIPHVMWQIVVAAVRRAGFADGGADWPAEDQRRLAYVGTGPADKPPHRSAALYLVMAAGAFHSVTVITRATRPSTFIRNAP